MTNVETTSYGHIAYKEYARTREKAGVASPAWDDLSPEERVAWEAAGDRLAAFARS